MTSLLAALMRGYTYGTCHACCATPDAGRSETEAACRHQAMASAALAGVRSESDVQPGYAAMISGRKLWMIGRSTVGVDVEVGDSISRGVGVTVLVGVGVTVCCVATTS